MNGNPFYVPPVIPDMSDTILGIGRLSADKEYRQGMLEQGQQRLDIESRRLPPSQQNFAPSDFLPMKSILVQKGLDKPLSPILDRLDQWGQKKEVTKGVAANTLASEWESFFKPQAIEGLKKEYLARSTKDPNFVGSGKDKELLAMIDSFSQMDGETAKKAFFPQVAEEEANSKAALAQIRAERAGKDPYLDARLRAKAKVDSFESAMGRKATTDEKRRLFISDPYGILAPGDETPLETPTLRPSRPGENKPSSTQKYSVTATDAKGNKIGWDGKGWVPIKK